MTNDAYLTGEARARVEIDRQLLACGWLVQDRRAMNLYAAQGVAVREFIMATGHGRADYMLFVDGKAAGAVEAKPSGTPLTGVEPQSAKYAAGLPRDLTALVKPLPFVSPTCPGSDVQRSAKSSWASDARHRARAVSR